ncbi:MAG TPA: Ig-like domain-containing protein, partial [Candidatus Limadaptatus stercoripullorum]|nr:Ig-like domain-containing protein [Candidatus Limadaptatus stercoripullorum]
MKKLMIGILVIIPLIVMLTVGLISRYVSQKVHIGVDSVSFSTDTLSVNLSDFTQDADGNFTIDLAALLEPEVLPSHAAAANSLEWSIEDVEPSADELGGIPAATLPDASKGTVVVSTYCSFFVIAQAEQASARCYVEVTDKEVQSVTLYSPSGSVAVGGSVKLTPQYTPLNSIVTQGSWSTGDPSVATVDANGVVTGKAAGSAVITFVTHTDGGAKEVRATYTITVTAAATVFGDKFYSHLTDIALSDILAPGVSAEVASVVGGSISGGELSLDSDECTVTLASGETFTVIRCGKDDITILNKDIFAYDPEAEDPFVVATDEIPLDLDAAYLSAFRAGETPAGISWQLVSGEGIASLSADGVVTASATGSMTVRVTAAGGASDEIELVSVAKVAALRLAMTESSLAVGLARETVFATREYDANGELTASGVDVTLLAPVLAEDATAEETAAHYGSFEFEVAPEDADKAYFGGTYGNRLIFNPEAVTERTTVTFTVSAKYPKYPG